MIRIMSIKFKTESFICLAVAVFFSLCLVAEGRERTARGDEFVHSIKKYGTPQGIGVGSLSIKGRIDFLEKDTQSQIAITVWWKGVTMNGVKSYVVIYFRPSDKGGYGINGIYVTPLSDGLVLLHEGTTE